MRISDWSSDVCSSDLALDQRGQFLAQLVIFPFRPRGEFLAGSRQRLEPRVLQLLERLEALGDRREFLERVGFSNSSIAARLSVLSSSSSSKLSRFLAEPPSSSSESASGSSSTSSSSLNETPAFFSLISPRSEEHTSKIQSLMR